MGRGGAGVSGDADLGGLGYALVGWVSDVGAWVVGWKARAASDGFHALHWNMFSWFEFGGCMGVLHVFRRGWVVLCMIGGCMLGLG